MTKEISNNNISHDEDGLHITELTEIALYNPEAWEAVQRMLDNDIPQDKIVKFMRKILKRR